MHEIKIFIAINEDGEFTVSKEDLSTAIDELNGDVNSLAIRSYALKINVPDPKVAEVSGTLPDTDGPVTLTIT